MLVLTSAIAGIGPVYAGVLAGLIPAAVMAGPVYVWNLWWREERGRLRADETGLWLDTRCIVRRSALRHAYIRQVQGRSVVRLGRMFRPVDVEIANDQEGEAFLASMRLDAARSVAQYRMSHGTWRGAWLRVGLMLAAFAVVPLAAWLLHASDLVAIGTVLAALFLLNLYALNQSVRVSVGADGLRVRRLLERARFLPFSSIDDADTDGRDLEIRLTDGRRISMYHPAGRGWKPLLFHEHALEGRKLVERIKEQLAAHRARPNVEAPVFARAGRDTDTWLRAVVAATGARASFRTPAVPAEALWRIVEDSAAAPTARAGAAVALRDALDDGGRVRLRALADACAAPRLRVALESVASYQDDDGVRLALEPLDDREHEGASRSLVR